MVCHGREVKYSSVESFVYNECASHSGVVTKLRAAEDQIQEPFSKKGRSGLLHNYGPRLKLEVSQIPRNKNKTTKKQRPKAITSCKKNN